MISVLNYLVVVKNVDDKDKIEYLMNKGININQTDEKNKNILINAIESNSVKLVNYCI